MADHHPNLEPRRSGGARPWTTPQLDVYGALDPRSDVPEGMNKAPVFDDERRERALAAGIIAEGCSYCEQHYPGMMPSHTASPRCQSGKRNHCTCDTCF